MDYLADFDKLVMNKCREFKQAENLALNNIALGRIERSSDGGFNAKRPILKKDIIQMISNNGYNVKQVNHLITDDFIEALNITGYSSEQINDALTNNESLSELTSGDESLSLSSSSFNEDESDDESLSLSASDDEVDDTPEWLEDAERQLRKHHRLRDRHGNIISQPRQESDQEPVHYSPRPVSSVSRPGRIGASPNRGSSTVKKNLQDAIDDAKEHTRQGKQLTQVIKEAAAKTTSVLKQIVRTPKRLQIKQISSPSSSSVHPEPVPIQAPQPEITQEEITQEEEELMRELRPLITDKQLYDRYLTVNYTKKTIRRMAEGDQLSSDEIDRLEHMLKRYEHLPQKEFEAERERREREREKEDRLVLEQSEAIKQLEATMRGEGSSAEHAEHGSGVGFHLSNYT